MEDFNKQSINLANDFVVYGLVFTHSQKGCEK